MLVYGYAKDWYNADDGTLKIKVRIPQIHGAYKQSYYKGQKIRNYVLDGDLPYYNSVILPRNPNEGDVVVLLGVDGDLNSEMLVIGLTGATAKEVTI